MLIGKKAPAIHCEAVVDGQIKQLSLADYQHNYKILFFYPLDFTFVCPTELQAFEQARPLFEKEGAIILGISVDSVYSHLAWLQQPKGQGGIQGISYPLLSDITKQIARDYDVLDEVAGIAYRALFIIDKSDIIQSIQINNLSIGRNIQETLRLVQALKFSETHGEVCPANWSLGQEGMKPTEQGLKTYFKKKS